MVSHLGELAEVTRGELYDLPAATYVPRMYVFLDEHVGSQRAATMEFFFEEPESESWGDAFRLCRDELASRGKRAVGAVLSFHQLGEDAGTLEMHAMTDSGSTHRRSIRLFRDSRGSLCPRDAPTACTDGGGTDHPDVSYIANIFKQQPVRA